MSWKGAGMTIGWVYEGDLERVLSRQPVPDPVDDTPRFVCPFCKTIFNSGDSLDLHVSEAHAIKRPILQIDGDEPAREHVLRAGLTNAAIELISCSEIHVAVDGDRAARIDQERLRSLLRETRRATLRVCLLNRPKFEAQPVSHEYRIRIDVPEENDLKSVEQAFVHILGRSDPTLFDVEKFNEVTRDSSATEYAGAMANFVRGVLVKDGDRSSGITGTFNDYQSAFKRSLSVLKSFDRALPTLLSAFIRFDLNDFSLWRQPSGSQKVDQANRLLGPLAAEPHSTAGNVMAPYVYGTGERLTIPVDAGLDAVAAICHRLSEAARWSATFDLEAAAIVDEYRYDPLDRAKLLAAYAASALRLKAYESARPLLDALDGDPTFGTWAAATLTGFET
jgi:hypothetical protein